VAKINQDELAVYIRKGFTPSQLAAHFAVTPATVKRAITKLHADWAKERSLSYSDIDTIVQQKQHILQEAMHAWDQSKKAQTRKTAKRKTKTEGGVTTTEENTQVVEISSPGDAAYLAAAMKAAIEIEKSVGLSKKNSGGSSFVGKQVNVFQIASNDRQAKLERMMSASKSLPEPSAREEILDSEEFPVDSIDVSEAEAAYGE
jgi:hypothetical protein